MSFPSMPILGTVATKANPWIAGATLGVDVLKGLFGGLSANSQAEAQEKLQRDQMAQQQQQFQGNSALQATQMDPFAQQKQRQKQALLSMLQANPGMTVPTQEQAGSIASYFSPEARQAVDQQFQNTAQAVGGSAYGIPDLSTMGYGTSSGGGAPRQNPIIAALRERMNGGQ